MPVAVELKGVSKRFSRGPRTRTLVDAVLGWPRRLMRRRSEDGLLEHEFWALRDLSFQLEKGAMLGVIGPNGSGKSTLLKLLFRILRPETGQVTTVGRVGGLIELGAGFHPYLSGRENVFINGAILGLRQREIRQRYDSIVDFSGLREFMDMPVKNYSSGMYARLAFAVAAHAEVDVLLVDEVLAVGDASFQMKCYDWMARRRKQGVTIVCVSHNMYVINSASRCLFLADGEKQLEDDPPRAIERYLETVQARGEASLHMFTEAVGGQPRAEILRVELLDGQGNELKTLEHDSTLLIRFHYLIREELECPIMALTLQPDDARFPVQVPSHYFFHVASGTLLKHRGQPGEGVVEVEVPQVRLPVGTHRVNLYCFNGSMTHPIWVKEGATRIEVLRPIWSDRLSLMDHRQQWRVLAPEQQR